MSKITVIGTGSVGSTIAYALTCLGLASEIVMIDINGEKSMGEALDIKQGVPFFDPCSVYAGGYPDAAGSDIVIITSGIARKPGQTRLDLVKTNVSIQKSIVPEIVKYAPDAIYIMVSNPVDVLTYTFCRLSGIPTGHVFGTGTLLDTARLRSRLSEYCGIDPGNIHAYVLGEHGDSSFIPWSVCEISGIAVDSFRNSVSPSNLILPEIDKDKVAEYVKTSGSRIISRKGATFYAVSSAVCHLCKCVLHDSNTALTVSSMLDGEYGVSDVCLSTLNVIGRKGVTRKIVLPLCDDDTARLRNSAEILKETVRSLDL